MGIEYPHQTKPEVSALSAINHSRSKNKQYQNLTSKDQLTVDEDRILKKIAS
ncbi:hypothetical protein AA106556_1791 [Neokomagataea tanensis NBRC 106556]|uniref:Transposase n=1 Tax=Neokomagataea tanensis NBRC 106556 TaxID=1223519 RepID=A0ABQ0QKW6_9PROT|nr:hypothetical protein AA106556_1791 [Neokomagataea tanensis NBRC 106556]